MSDFLFDRDLFKAFEDLSKAHLRTRRLMMEAAGSQQLLTQLRKFGVCSCHCHFTREAANGAPCTCRICACASKPDRVLFHG